MAGPVIGEQRIFLDIEAENKEACLSRLVNRISEREEVVNAQVLLDDLLAREQLSTTGIGRGCAVPHAHSEGVRSTFLCAARCTIPLDFGSEDGQPVRLIFLLAGPPKNTSRHLQLLSKLVRILHQEDLRAQLIEAPTPHAFHAILEAQGL